jgi:hypothetical protein
VLSVTCPLVLALVDVVLELRANEALESMKPETNRTRSRRRNVIGITATWNTLENSLLPLVLRASASESSARNVEGQSVKLKTDAKKISSYCDGK